MTNVFGIACAAISVIACLCAWGVVIYHAGWIAGFNERTGDSDD